MAGYRCGYVVGPHEVMPVLTRVSTHAFYSTPTPSQAAACVVLDGRGDEWIARARAQYADTGRRAAARLGVASPDGSTFLWLDVAKHLGDRGLEGFLEECADEGLCLAPGTSFGPYPSHVRLCYTAQPPDAVMRGVERLAEILERR
jgi:N-succinyldiaminopimelate aminotransferase